MYPYKAYFSLMRFDKPIGTLLLLWPTLWALWIAAQGFPGQKIFWVFVFGVIVMRAAGCVMNDFADREFDRQVKRTQNRPITTGKISGKSALLLFLGLCIIALLLVLCLNRLTVLLAIPAILLAIIYPFTKRFIKAPQCILSLAFSFGIPMAFAAVLNTVPEKAWLLFAANAAWVIGYDTMYAMIDKEDDIKLGIQSTAILFGNWEVSIITGLNAIFIALWLTFADYLSFKPYFYVGVFLAMGVFCYQYMLYRSRLPVLCFKAFLSSHWVGFFIFTGIILNYAV